MSGLSAFPLPFQATRSMAFATPRTLREIEMMQCSAHLREKTGWFDKMNDAGIVARWTREALEQGLTEAQVRYVLAELAHYAGLRDAETGVEVASVDGVWQSDALVDDELGSRLREAVRVLEEVPDAEKDWHPGSDGQVLDLVHPSLFCLVREASGAPERAWRNPTDSYSKYEFSERFQWLPTDVDVSEKGEVSFRSYVNNVHPELHRDLLPVLADVFARMVPLLENVLTDLRRPRPLRIEADLRVVRLGAGASEQGRLQRRGGLREARRDWQSALDDWCRTAGRSPRTPRPSPLPHRPTRPRGSDCAAAGCR